VGMKTAAYEIAEQYSWIPPDRIYLPVSAGTLLLGLIEGFKDLQGTGIIEKIPKIIAVQPKSCPSLYEAYKKVKVDRSGESNFLADALTAENPPRLRQMVNELKSVDGDVEIVTDEELLKAHKQLGLAGIYTETSSATAYAAVRKHLDEIISRGEKVLVIVTGFGCKSTQHLQLVD